MFIEITDSDLEYRGLDARRFIAVNHIICFRSYDGRDYVNDKRKTVIRVTGGDAFIATEGCDHIQVKINRALSISIANAQLKKGAD